MIWGCPWRWLRATSFEKLLLGDLSIYSNKPAINRDDTALTGDKPEPSYMKSSSTGMTDAPEFSDYRYWTALLQPYRSAAKDSGKHARHNNDYFEHLISRIISRNGGKMGRNDVRELLPSQTSEGLPFTRIPADRSYSRASSNPGRGNALDLNEGRLVEFHHKSF